MHIRQLAGHFVSKGDEVVVMSAPAGWLAQETRSSGAKHMPNPFLSNSINPINLWRAYKSIRQAFIEFSPDVIHCHSTVAGILGRLASRNRWPVIFTAHGWPFEPGTPRWRRLLLMWVERYLAHYCKKIVCVSKYTRTIALKNNLTRPDKLTVVYNGVELCDPVGKPSEKTTVEVLFVGRLSKQKDPMTLLRAYGLINSSERSRISITIIGDGPDIGRLKEFIDQHALAGVRLLGGLNPSDVRDEMRRADVFVLSTNWEGFPYVILEAMSSGLPIIATDVGGISEAVGTANGFLVKKKDALALSKAITILLENRSLRESLGAESRRIIMANFTLDKMFSEIERVYGEVLKK